MDCFVFNCGALFQSFAPPIYICRLNVLATEMNKPLLGKVEPYFMIFHLPLFLNTNQQSSFKKYTGTLLIFKTGACIIHGKGTCLN